MNKRNIFFTAICIAILSVPLVLLFISGEAPHDFDGEKDYPRPAFSLAGFFNGTFQTDFENWFSTKYPLRPQIVEAYGVLDAGKDAVSLGGRAETGYRGNANVIIGTDGWLYENGYINEYFGYAQKYTEVTDAQLLEKVSALKEIQNALAEKGVPFCLVITPSKASAVPRFIPEWYTARYEAAQGYGRPYARFVQMLIENEVAFIDSAELFQEINLTDYFPKTSSHWTKLAAFEAVSAIISEYERQAGREVKHLAYDEILQGAEPPGFGNSETDIFTIVYAGRRNELANAVRDDAYYWPDAYAVGEDKPDMGKVFVQGGSFADDIVYYLEEYGIASAVSKIRYNNSNDPASVDWDAEIGASNFVLLEVNEQFVHNIGGSGPVFGQSDLTELRPGENIIEAMKAYLTGGNPQ